MTLYCGVFGEKEIEENDIERICLGVGRINCIWCEGTGKQRIIFPKKDKEGNYYQYDTGKYGFCRTCKGTGKVFISA